MIAGFHWIDTQGDSSDGLFEVRAQPGGQQVFLNLCAGLNWRVLLM